MPANAYAPAHLTAAPLPAACLHMAPLLMARLPLACPGDPISRSRAQS